MFPTIFALSLKDLGPYTKLGSSLLVMSIIGGAIVPALMGYISDASNIRYAFIVPFVCHLYVFYFAARGYRPRPDGRIVFRVGLPSSIGSYRINLRSEDKRHSRTCGPSGLAQN
jgi:hypothetical protein